MSYKDPQKIVYYGFILLSFSVIISIIDPLGDVDAKQSPKNSQTYMYVNPESTIFQESYKYNNYCSVTYAFYETGFFMGYQVQCHEIDGKSFTKINQIKTDIKFKYYEYINILKSHGVKSDRVNLDW